jgi:hypothetical protein
MALKEFNSSECNPNPFPHKLVWLLQQAGLMLIDLK